MFSDNKEMNDGIFQGHTYGQDKPTISGGIIAKNKSSKK